MWRQLRCPIYAAGGGEERRRVGDLVLRDDDDGALGLSWLYGLAIRCEVVG